MIAVYHHLPLSFFDFLLGTGLSSEEDFLMGTVLLLEEDFLLGMRLSPEKVLLLGTVLPVEEDFLEECFLIESGLSSGNSSEVSWVGCKSWVVKK